MAVLLGTRFVASFKADLLWLAFALVSPLWGFRLLVQTTPVPDGTGRGCTDPAGPKA